MKINNTSNNREEIIELIKECRSAIKFRKILKQTAIRMENELKFSNRSGFDKDLFVKQASVKLNDLKPEIEAEFERLYQEHKKKK